MYKKSKFKGKAALSLFLAMLLVFSQANTIFTAANGTDVLTPAVKADFNVVPAAQQIVDKPPVQEAGVLDRRIAMDT